MACREKDEQKAQYLRAIFDAIPLPTFIVDSDVRIEDYNTAAEPFLGDEPAVTLHRRGGIEPVRVSYVKLVVPIFSGRRRAN